MRYTAKELHDLVSRAKSVIETSDGADEHHELLGELTVLEGQLADITMTGNDVLIHTHNDDSDGTLDENERRQTHPHDYE